MLETTLTGVALRFFGSATVAVTGAAAPVRLDGQPAGWGVPVPVRSGQLLDIGRATAGVRSYVAVSGGFAVPQALGSASTDLLSGLGPAPLTADQILTTGEAPGSPAATGPRPGGAPQSGPTPTAPASAGEVPTGPVQAGTAPHGPAQAGPASAAPAGGPVEIPVRLGPRDSWLAPAGRATLAGATFTVALASNRIGVRLQGPPVEQAVTGELSSEGIVWGAVQLLPDGNLVIFLADHPTTGGYPVIAVVDPAGFSACAQAAPGTSVRFRTMG